ncbi:MAG: hypothetical protein AB1664_14275 [Thermodesulfobacteriota bacterium]
MKTGLLEKILTRRYGQPTPCIRDRMVARSWNTDRPENEAVLYVGMEWRGVLGARFASLKEIYGDAFGGFLVGDSLRAALLAPTKVWALWNIDDFRIQPEVQHALVKDPAIDYFMDESNVYFYGIKAGRLYVFDAETDELDCLGPVEQALETLLDEQEALWRDLP